MRKLKIFRVMTTPNETIIVKLVFVWETIRHERYNESVVFPANLSSNVLTTTVGETLN